MADILSTAQMREAEAFAVRAGLSLDQLMENAGRRVFEAVTKHIKPSETLVLCGPGNNGGDGFVAARLLKEAGWNVRVLQSKPTEGYTGPAAKAAKAYDGKRDILAMKDVGSPALVIDALYGAGLSRPLEGVEAEVIEHLARRGASSVAVDVPSGVNADSGEVAGPVLPALFTVTFFRRRPGQLLMPGKRFCGRTLVADIGISDKALTGMEPVAVENVATLWNSRFKAPGPETHKYHAGHAVVLSGDRWHTGAARLAAMAALRAGAGLVTVACEAAALPLMASGPAALLTRPLRHWRDMKDLLADPRRNAFLIGPGAGMGEATRHHVLTLLGSGRSVVLDADALTVFRHHQNALFALIQGPTILTPHAGEFRRLFPDLTGDKLAQTRAAALRSKAVVVHKGSDTVIAAPDGRVAINANAPAWLATAGSGDVLAGICLALLARGMEPFYAACAAVWLHGDAANHAGPGLIADDLPEKLPAVLQALYGIRKA
ncbi:MAG: NAD(P)H-hydrate dehydratase [Alphaproteobacteria bacterium]|nr:NAD(P)H-hydrate dehydratase [Alphaproteobacteria bacterium]